MVNKSEEYVYKICQKSFLSLWGYVNPQARKGKELCDILVVCGNNIIIISVKDITPSNSGNVDVDWERWRKRAIDSSVKQIYGAERWLTKNKRVITKDGMSGLPLPPENERTVHRIAVAFGSDGKMGLYYGDFGKGFVHVLDEQAFDTLLAELDTISDFLAYLMSKELFFAEGGYAIFEGQEEDLFALYLKSGRKLPAEPDLLVIGDDLWKTFIGFSEYQAKKKNEQVSYLWDAIIEAHIRGISSKAENSNSQIVKFEPALRELALEDRYWRRVLSQSLLEFLDLAKAKKVRSRIAISAERKVAYVFLPAWREDDAELRMVELSARC